MRCAISDNKPQFFTSSIWTLSASMAANVLNYGFQLIVAYLLLPKQYAECQALLGAYIVLGVPLSSLMMLVAKRVAELTSEGLVQDIKLLLKRLFIWTLAGYLCSGSIVFLWQDELAEFLKIETGATVSLFYLSFYLTTTAIAMQSVIQGQSRFGLLSWFLFLSSFSKFVFTTLVVWVWPTSFAVFAGLSLSNLFLSLYGTKKAFEGFESHLESDKVSTFPGISWTIIATTLLGNIGFAVLTQIDVLYANKFLANLQAADFAAAAMLSKTQIFVSLALVMVMFPMVSGKSFAFTEKLAVLRNALLLCTSILFVGLFFIVGIPNEITELLFSGKYPNSGEILSNYGPRILCFSYVVVLLNFLIAQENKIYSIGLAATACAGVSYLFLSEKSLESLMNFSLYFSLLALLLGVFCVWLEYLKTKRSAIL